MIINLVSEPPEPVPASVLQVVAPPPAAPTAADQSFERRFVRDGFRVAELFNIDVRSHMRVADQASAVSVREKIAAFVWPSGRPADPLTKKPNVSFPVIQTVRAAEEWTLTMRHGVVSQMFFLKSSGDAGCLFLYHEGHEPKPITTVSFVKELATELTGRGCDVLLLSMPLHGINAQQSIEVDGASKAITANGLHNDFFALESKEFSPFSYFVDPVVRALDEATKSRSYTKIGMAGLSGGGWTTTFVGAIEPRLTNIYPVAGSMPFEVDMDPTGPGIVFSSLRGDYEQSHQRFYREVAGYFDLYVLGSGFPNRRATHVYNAADNCCFPGVISNAFAKQTEQIAQERLGGDLRFIVDHTATKHEVSHSTLQRILNDFMEP